MKFVKFSIFALTMGLFIASCGNNSSESTTNEDSTAMAPAMDTAATTPAPMADTTHMMADTTKAATPAK